jgi:hypothetical protein
MFIVTAAGVIATDPISERRPAKPNIEAIQEVTKHELEVGRPSLTGPFTIPQTPVVWGKDPSPRGALPLGFDCTFS